MQQELLRDLIVTSASHYVAASRALAIRSARLHRYQRSQTRKLHAAVRAAGLDPATHIP